jgi:hypothetical protein
VSEFKPEALLANPFISGLLGSIIGLRAMSGASWWLRACNLFGGWACAILFGPAIAASLGMLDTPHAFAGVVGATGAFGLVAVDGFIRYLQETPIIDVLTRLLNVFRGGGK